MELQGELPVLLTLSSDVSIEYLKCYISILLVPLKHKNQEYLTYFPAATQEYSGMVFRNLKLWLSFSIDFYQQVLASTQRPIQYLSGKLGRGCMQIYFMKLKKKI